MFSWGKDRGQWYEIRLHSWNYFEVDLYAVNNICGQMESLQSVKSQMR